MNAFLASIPLDKYLHMIGSVIIFAAVHWLLGDALVAFEIAILAHVVKKGYDVIILNLRDLSDIFGDIGFGVAGAALAWVCILVR